MQGSDTAEPRLNHAAFGAGLAQDRFPLWYERRLDAQRLVLGRVGASVQVTGPTHVRALERQPLGANLPREQLDNPADSGHEKFHSLPLKQETRRGVQPGTTTGVYIN